MTEEISLAPVTNRIKNSFIEHSSMLNKFTKILIFLFVYFLIFKTIDRILVFFNLHKDVGYSYFTWITILLFFFVLLPIRKSMLVL